MGEIREGSSPSTATRGVHSTSLLSVFKCVANRNSTVDGGTDRNNGDSYNGSTADFDSVGGSSTLSSPAKGVSLLEKRRTYNPLTDGALPP